MEGAGHLGLEAYLHHVRPKADVPEEVSDAAWEQGQSERSVEDHLQQSWLFAVAQSIHDLPLFVFQQLVWGGWQLEDVLHLPHDSLQKLGKMDVSEGHHHGTSP